MSPLILLLAPITAVLVHWTSLDRRESTPETCAKLEATILKDFPTDGYELDVSEACSIHPTANCETFHNKCGGLK